MGVQPDQAKRLTYWEFTALRHGHIQRNKVEGADAPMPLPDPEHVRASWAELERLGISGRAH